MSFLKVFFTVFGVLSVAVAEEWTGDLNSEINLGYHPKNTPHMTVIHDYLDFGAAVLTIDGQECLMVKVRNGKHKMGKDSIKFKHEKIEGVYYSFQRTGLLKSMSEITSLGDGQHLLDTFIEDEKSYSIYFEVKNKKLQPTITVKLNK